MSGGVGGIHNNQRTNAEDFQNNATSDIARRTNNNIRTDQSEQVGSGQINGNQLTVTHQNASIIPNNSDRVIMGDIPPTQHTNALQLMDSTELQTLIAGLRNETSEVQEQMQVEQVRQQNTNRQEANNERLEQLQNELGQVEDSNKCAQATANVCMCIPGINVIVGLPAMGAAIEGEKKADAIRSEIMLENYGPEIGSQMIEFMEGYEKISEKGVFASQQEKQETQARMTHLHQAGAIDDVTFYELNKQMDDGFAGGGGFGQSSAIDKRLTEMALGIKKPMFDRSEYPEGMLERQGYVDASEESVTQEQPSEITGNSSGQAVEVQETSREWIQNLAIQMQQAEEQENALTRLQQDIEEATSAITQSNSENLNQQIMNTRSI